MKQAQAKSLQSYQEKNFNNSLTSNNILKQISNSIKNPGNSIK
jgi:hypothetical protein